MREERIAQSSFDFGAVMVICSAVEFAIILGIYAIYAPEHIPDKLELPMIIFIGKAILFGTLGIFFFVKHWIYEHKIV